MHNTFKGFKARFLLRFETLAGVAIAIALLGHPMQRGAAETIHYTDSGSATQTEIRRLDHLNWDQGQSLAAMESTTGLGTPNDYTQESDGSFTATYKIEGLQPVDSAGVIPAHGTVQVDYTWDSARGWVTEGKPTVWTAGTAGFAEGAN